ncbi:TIGR00295 family protein [Candidatus Bathyarchaeota archaeon]|nr:TIGR00295 family protein [Candidatus Bathyarchaeota archaeon]
MSEKLPTREQALQYLRESGCSENVIRHCEAVTELAVEIAKACKEKGLNVNLELVEIGALLHDIGRAKTHSVHHAVAGMQIAKSLGLPKPVISIIKRHVGGGIIQREAKNLGWPKGVYVPQTIEEKIVAYADKLIEGSKRIPIEKTIEKLSKELPPPAIARIRKLHEEMLTMIGDCKCLP